MQSFIRIFGIKFVFLFFLFGSANSQVQKDTLDVLFVGNSFIYFNNMPQMVQAMSLGSDQIVRTYQSTVGGSSLKDHWLSERNTRTRKILLEKKWDYVVLNNHSLVTINDYDNFIKYTKLFDSLIKSIDAKPILMMTWAYRSNPLMQEKISKSYLDIGKDLNTYVLPVGDVFMKARRLRPDVNFYTDDKHPNQDFSYLIALMSYNAITNTSLSSISGRLTTKDLYGEKTYLSLLSNEMSSFLKQIVEESDLKSAKVFYEN